MMQEAQTRDAGTGKPAHSPATQHPLRRFFIVFAAILVTLLIIYIPATRGTFLWDDEHDVANNLALRTSSGLVDIWSRLGTTAQYYPLTFTTFWIEWHLWGDHPAGYKVTNIVFHALAAAMVWAVLTRLRVRGALAAAFIFAVHPLQVESVAWIAERKNVLSAFLFFAALLAYLLHARLGPDGTIENATANGTAKRKNGFYALSIALLVLALLTKSVASVLPVVILLITWWKRGHVTRADLIPLVPMFVLGLMMGSVTGYMEKNYVGAQGADWKHADSLPGEVLVRCLIAGRVTWFYVGKLLYPHPLIFTYGPRWVMHPTDGAFYIFPAAVAAVLFALWLLRHRLGRGPLTAVMYYLIVLAPAMGFANVYQMRFAFVSDHFQYLATVGLIVLGCAGIATFLAERFPARATRAGRSMAAVVVLGLCVLTYRQGSIYKNTETLWRSVIAATDGKSWIAHNNLGVDYLNRGEIAQAEAEFREVIALRPTHAEAFMNLGLIEEKRGNLPGAMIHYDRAAAARSDFVQGLAQRAALLARMGRRDEAIAAYQQIRDIPPERRLRSYGPFISQAMNNLGTLYSEAGRLDDALAAYQRAIDIDPNSTLAYANLGNAFATLGQTDAALAAYAQAKTSADTATAVSICNIAGMTLASRGYLREAEVQFRDALTRDPRSAEAWRNLGMVLGQGGRLDLAIDALRQAVTIEPSNPQYSQMYQAAVAEMNRRRSANGTPPGNPRPPGPPAPKP